MYSIEGHHEASILILTPLLDQTGSLPYYHPQVFHIAFRYFPSTPASDPRDGANAISGARLQVEVVSFPSVPLDPNSRIYRTCLALLETLHRYGWGAMTSYKKRVNHDCIIPREEYQDLYLHMREKYKHLVGTWQESTDPLKHVFEVCAWVFGNLVLNLLAIPLLHTKKKRREQRALTVNFVRISVLPHSWCSCGEGCSMRGTPQRQSENMIREPVTEFINLTTLKVGTVRLPRQVPLVDSSIWGTLAGSADVCFGC